MLPQEVLERNRVLLQAKRTADQIDAELAAGVTTFSSNGQEVRAVEAMRVRDDLRAAVRAERFAGTTGQHSPDVFLPRSPVLSNLQGLVADRVAVGTRQSQQEMVAAGGGDDSPTDYDVDFGFTEGFGVASSEYPIGQEPPVTSYSVADKLNDALEPLIPGAGQQIVPYSEQDPHWLICGLAIAWRDVEALLNGDRKFNSSPAEEKLGPRSRLFLFGDWGSGIPRARKVAAAINQKLHDDESRNRDCHVVHLGDTYFAGFPWEQQWHVLDLWPVKSESWATSWALPGNHDYYSGGGGFYETLLADRRFTHQSSPAGKPTSIFEIANDRWMILGMDTGFAEHDLVPEERAWLKTRLEDPSTKGKGVVLLSHHQPWSVFNEGPNPPPWQRLKKLLAWLENLFTGKSGQPMLWSRVQPLLTNRRAEAWFWGHEHRLALYTERPEIRRPRLLGNGGVPAKITDSRSVDDESLLILDYEDPLGHTTALAPWCRFAFAVIDLDPDGRFTETYYDEDGQLIAVPPSPQQPPAP